MGIGLQGAYGADAVQQELIRMVEEQAKRKIAEQQEAHRQAQMALATRGMDIDERQGDARIGLDTRRVGLDEETFDYGVSRDTKADEAAAGREQKIAGYITGLPTHLQGAAQGSQYGMAFKPEEFVNAPETREAQETRERERIQFSTNENIRQTRATRPPAGPASRTWVMRNGSPVRVTEAEIQPGDQPYERQDAGSQATATKEANEVADTVSLIDQIAGDPALDDAVGFVDARGLGVTRNPDGVTRFSNLHNQLVGKLQLALAGKLRGQGQVSDRERAMLLAAATALSRTLSEKDYKAELGKIRAQFERMQSGGVPTPAPTGGGSRGQGAGPAGQGGGGARIGERRTINGQLAEWDGRGWAPVGGGD